MYGLINKALQEMITERFGREQWQEIHSKSGIEVDYFLGDEVYPDEITYRLLDACCQVVELSVEEILRSFGEHWILHIAWPIFGSLIMSSGKTLEEFIRNLPNFHSRIMLIYPRMEPPEFRIKQAENSSMHLFYYSKRKGLGAFLEGIVQGLGKIYNTRISIEAIEHTESDHDEFLIKW